jgi:hypothetical protein
MLQIISDKMVDSAAPKSIAKARQFVKSIAPRKFQGTNLK